MKTFLLGSIAVIALSTGSAALAADLAPVYKAPPPGCASANWGGFYGGVNVGAASKRTTLSDDGNSAAIFNGFAVGSHSDQTSGVAGGVQVGYNVQTCLTVWGIEADIDWANLNKSYGVTQTALGNDYTNSNQMKWFGTVRGRVGIAVENLLLFVTSGLAYANVNHAVTANSPPFGPATTPVGFNDTDTRWGWVIGAGAEWSLTNNLSLRSELLYAKFQEKSHTVNFAPLFPGQVNTFRSLDEVVVTRIGLNYRFGGGPVYAKY